MVVGGYSSKHDPRNNVVFEQNDHLQWPYKSLEEEIALLRSQMEHAVSQSHALTSEVVIRISRLLDKKIIQYMKKTGKVYDKNRIHM